MSRPRIRQITIPSCGPSLPSRRPLRLLAIVALRDEMRFLPGFFANVGPQVDGVIALDDGSTDGSLAFLEAREEVIELLRVSPDRPHWDEVRNHRRLVAAALGHGAGWVLALDADERLERDFRKRAERVIRRTAPLDFSSFAVRLRELWDSSDRYRADGVWGRKRPLRLFRALADHEFDDRPLHAIKGPLQARCVGLYPPLADLVVYHLRMISSADREARRRRYEATDPEGRWQRAGCGYAYLTDERGIHLRPVPAGRGFVE